ncbi:MAG: aspartate/glutamate racemase family protein [Alphaproteobacteria bacterium]
MSDEAAVVTRPIASLADIAAFDERPSRTRIGLLLLATDHTTERDFERVCVPLGVAVHCARIAYANPTTPENLREMAPRLATGTDLILPGETLDAVYFACTAASVEIGDDAVVNAIRSAKSGVPAVTPTGAALLAFAALRLHRVALLTPYSHTVTADVAAYFEARGIEVGGAACFGLEDDRAMARLTGDAIVAAAERTIRDDDDGLFLSCTALRAFDVADRIEQRIGRPVVTSNQAGIWQTLNLAGVSPPADAGGRLMRLPLPGRAAA